MSAAGRLLAASILGDCPREGAPARLGIALQAMLDRAAERGGGAVVLGPGPWETVPLTLKNRTGLVLEAGCRLLGSRDRDDYPIQLWRWEGKTAPAHAPLIGATGARGISITGKGTIDGRGAAWWEAFRLGELRYPRPRLIAFEGCDDVTLEGFTCLDSPGWTINPVRSRHIGIYGLRIDNPPDSPNTDGIDPDSCSDVVISGCSISAGDDCIAIKSGVETEEAGLCMPTEGVRIYDCVFESGHGGVVLGSEMSGGIRDISVTGCIFKGTDRGIRFKSRRRRGGRLEDMSFSDLSMHGVLCPVAVNFHYGCGAWGDPEIGDKLARPVGAGTPSLGSIRFSRIEAVDTKLCAAFLYGLPERPLEDISFNGYEVSMDEDWTEARQVEMGDGLPDMARRGFFARNVARLGLEGVRIRGALGPEFDLEGVR